jgi:hypothetical protein
MYEYGQVYRSFITTILDWEGNVPFQDLMDNVSRKCPDTARATLKNSLGQMLRYGYVVKTRIDGIKHYAIGQHCPAVYLNPQGDSDYVNGKECPIFDLFECVRQLFDVLKYPATSKQAFDVFVRMYPSMTGYKTCFDRALTELSLAREIAKSKDSLMDVTASNHSKFHYMSNAMYIQLKNNNVY